MDTNTDMTMEPETKEMFPKPMLFIKPGVEKIRLILLAFAILYTFGLHTAIGDIGGMVLGFAVPAMYIISGYLVLRESVNAEKRILFSIMRTAICFVIMFALSVGLSIIADKTYTLELLKTGAFWRDFLLLNMCKLPIGSTVWYVQAMLYAYVIIYVIYKLRLLRFDILIALICLAVTLVSGELSALVKFDCFGHAYVGGNFITRALPYILIGNFIHRKRDFFGRIGLGWCIFIGIFGFALSFGEYFGLRYLGKLTYTGHMLGMALVAISICLIAFYMNGIELRSYTLNTLNRFELMIPYYVCSPIYMLLVRFFSANQSKTLYQISRFIGPITLICSFLLMYLYAIIRSLISGRQPDDFKKYNTNVLAAQLEQENNDAE